MPWDDTRLIALCRQRPRHPAPRYRALNLAATTLLRPRFFSCSATRALARIGYQPRRDPGEVAHPPTGGSSSSSGVPSS
ncbi:MAG: hypothetical protein ABIZ56_04020 [Chthoniobacteraceae bacterium]